MQQSCTAYFTVRLNQCAFFEFAFLDMKTILYIIFVTKATLNML